MTPSSVVFSLAMVLGLSACAETSRPATPTVDQTKTPTVAPPAAEKPMTVLAPVKPTAPPAPPKEYPPLSHLSGLDHDQVTGLLGTPGFKRKDDPALIWQYRSPACTLDLFLYRTGNEKPYSVLHFETRSRGNVGVSDKDCFVGLLKAHEQRG